VTDAAFEVVATEGIGFQLKERASQRLYRIAAARDPGQPRLWCVLVYRCGPGGVPDAAERPWLGTAGMAREDVATTLAGMRADIDAWLARDECGELRAWLLAPAATPSVLLAPARVQSALRGAGGAG
jgi:hypothetical protein